MDKLMTIKELQQKLNADNECSTATSTEDSTDVVAIENNSVDVKEQAKTKFEHAMDAVKLNVLAEAANEDEKFVKTVKETLKSAAVSNTQVEESKANLEKKKVEYQAATVNTAIMQNEHQAAENKWLNREKKRQYHYNGVKPIMMFAGIEEPLNLFLLYLLTLILSPFFLLAKLLRGTIGILLSAACDPDKPKSIKGLIWTILATITILTITAVVYLFLKWQGLI